MWQMIFFAIKALDQSRKALALHCLVQVVVLLFAWIAVKLNTGHKQRHSISRRFAALLLERLKWQPKEQHHPKLAVNY
jgi:hypothetical protein